TIFHCWDCATARPSGATESSGAGAAASALSTTPCERSRSCHRPRCHWPSPMKAGISTSQVSAWNPSHLGVKTKRYERTRRRYNAADPRQAPPRVTARGSGRCPGIPSRAGEPRPCRERIEREPSVIKGFKEFILRGNVVELAVAVVMGTAFGAVVTALVQDI